MKKRQLSLLFILLAAGFTSCGIDLLDLELPEGGAPKLVVEGGISNQAAPHNLQLSWSSSFNSNRTNGVENALVILSDEQGKADTLRHLGSGRYESMAHGIPGNQYMLTILLEGKQYEAQSRMPKPAVVDSFSIRYHEESLLREEGYYVSLHNLDPEETEGYYRWLVWVNDTLQQTNGVPGYFATIDISKDNKSLQLQYPEPFKLGDHLRFRTIKMDKSVYLYYQELMELMLNDGGLMGPVPVNPQSNISGDALGVFQAISITETEIVIE